jgi:hypothetical protein
MEDPLAGLTRRQRQAHEKKAAAFLADYRPSEHSGWFAELCASVPMAVIVATRVDLDHPRLPGNTATSRCIDCDNDLQHEPGAPNGGLPKLCIACAWRRGRTDS